MIKKREIKPIELDLYFDDVQERWMIHSPAGAGLIATDFEVCLWKEIVRLRRQVMYLRNKNNHLRELIAIINQGLEHEK